MDLIKGDKDKYKKQFRKWDICLKAAKVNKIEDLYKKEFAEIRKNPDKVVKKKNVQKKVVRDKSDVNIVINGQHKYRRDVKLNRNQRKVRVMEKIQKYIKEREVAATTKSTKKKEKK